MTFWLSAPQPDVVTIPPATQVATVRTDTDEAIAFTTIEDLPIIPSDAGRARLDDRRQDAARPHGRRSRRAPRSTASRRCRRRATRCTSACPRRSRRTRSGCGSSADIEGVGVDPTNPPLAWEAWTGDDWEPCELDSDSTGGLNRDGDVVIHVPARPRRVADREAAGRLAAGAGRRSLAEGQPAYSASPNIKGLERDHDRRHRRRGQRRARHGRGDRASPRASRASASCSSAGRSCPATTTRVLEVGRRRRLGRVDLRARLRRQRPRRPALHARPRRRARSGSGRRSAWPTARSAATARCPSKGAHLRLRRVPDRRRPQGQRLGAGASACSSRRSRSCRASRTGVRPGAASTARTSRTPRSAGRSGCAPAAGP